MVLEVNSTLPGLWTPETLTLWVSSSVLQTSLISWCSLPWFWMQRWGRPRSSNDLGVACSVTWRRSQQEATDWTLALPKHGPWKTGYRSQGGSILFLFWWLPGSDPSAGSLVWGLLGEPETFKPLNTENQFGIIAAVLGWLWLWPGTLGRGK